MLCSNVANIVHLSLIRFMAFKINWDAVGVTASLACAIHCAILPIAFTHLSLLGVNLIHNNVFEYLMIFMSLLIGVYSIWHGYKTHHNKKFPFILLAIGFIFLLLKQEWHNYKNWLLIIAVLFITTAHYLNYKYCHAVAPNCSTPGHKH